MSFPHFLEELILKLLEISKSSFGLLSFAVLMASPLNVLKVDIVLLCLNLKKLKFDLEVSPSLVSSSSK